MSQGCQLGGQSTGTSQQLLPGPSLVKPSTLAWGQRPDVEQSLECPGPGGKAFWTIWGRVLPSRPAAPSRMAVFTSTPEPFRSCREAPFSPPLFPDRFGDGYMITVRTKSSLNVKEVAHFFSRNFPEAVLKVWAILGGKKEGLHLAGGGGGGGTDLPCLSSLPQERHHTKVQYQLKSEHISLAQVFSKMEQVVDVLGIEDYSVSQTTLDNVRGHFPFGHPLLSEEWTQPALCSLHWQDSVTGWLRMMGTPIQSYQSCPRHPNPWPGEAGQAPPRHGVQPD